MKLSLSSDFSLIGLSRFVLPSVVTMVFTSIYSIVDGYFVSVWVGKTEFASINLIFPVLWILGAIGVMFGTGGNALVAVCLGEGRREQANRLFSTFLLALTAGGLLISAAAYAALPHLIRWLGAEGDVFEDCLLYGRILASATVLWTIQYFFQFFMVTAERARMNTWITIAAGVTNGILDAMFILVFGWGLAGAAWATVAGQAVGAIIPLVYFLCPNGSLLRLRRPIWSLDALTRGRMNGLSELVVNITIPIVSVMFNTQLLLHAGVDGVAAWAVVQYICSIFVCAFIGIAAGAAPVVGYRYGAGNLSGVREIHRKVIFLLTACGFALCAFCLIFNEPLARLFVRYDGGLLQMTRHALLVFTPIIPVLAFNQWGSAFFTALNNGFVSALIALSRTFIFAVLCIQTLPRLLGTEGIWISQPVYELLAFLLIIWTYKRWPVQRRESAAGKR